MKKIYLLLAGFTLLSCNASLAQQWIAQQSNINPNNYIQFIDAVDTNVVWGLASDRNSQLNPVQEFTRTNDGGNTWVAGTITNAANCGPSCIMGLNADTAWVAMFDVSGGGKILRTNDGGLTWTHQSSATFSAPAGFPNVVHFFDANDGFCMGDPNGGYFEIYTTSDGGTNWIRVPQANIAANLAGEFGITDVYTSYGDSTLYFGTNKGRVYKSTDRGNNWTVSQTPYAGFLGSITFRDVNFGIASEADPATTSTNLAYTNDGGSTWSILPTLAAGYTLKQSVRYVPGTDSTFVLTTPYTIYGSAFSVDNGVNWKNIDNLIHSDCEFVNATTGWSGGGELGSPIYKWSGPLTIAINDVATLSVDVPAATGIATQNPKASFVNSGLATQNFNVTMEISGGYTSTKAVTSLGYNQSTQVSFDPWTPATVGTYAVTVYTQLATDTDLLNDTIVKTVAVYGDLPNYGWITRQPIALPRFGIASAYVRTNTLPIDTGYVFTTGGADFGAILQRHDRFNSDQNTYTLANPISAGVYQFCMNTVKNKVYAIGGYSGGFSPTAANYVYDFVTNAWTTGANMPIPVGDYASGVYQDSLIYYIGGYDGIADNNAVQIYNPSNNTWTVGSPKPGTSVAGLRGGIYNDKIIVVGGYSQNLQTEIDEVWLGTIDALNPALITWQSLGAYPGGTVGRLGAGTPYGNTFPYVIFTGGDPSGQGIQVKSDVWAYDFIANTWLIGPDKPTGVSNISNFASAIYNDSIYMVSVSGYDGNALAVCNDWLNLGASPFTGLPQLNQPSSSLLVYPNPATGNVTIVKPKEMNDATLRIFNSSGMLVQSMSTGSNVHMQVSVKSFAKGIYLIQLNGNGKIANARLSVE
jgi:photosystem II stability/assembly factor-like uncharacterized protein